MTHHLTATEITESLQNLNQEGGYFVGPCPVCGGTDRFSVHQQTARIYCRICKPGGKSSDERQAYHAIMKEITTRARTIKSTMTSHNNHPINHSAEFSPQQRAQRLFNVGQPIKGTYAQRWLANQRRITIDSSKLRYHPAIYHKDLAARYPCLLVRFDHCQSGELTAVQRIYFTLREKKHRKRFTGSLKNSGSLLAGNLNHKTIILTEGVEDALSIIHVVKNVAVWACGGKHNLENFTIPEHASAILIAADSDQVGLGAAAKLAQRAHATDRKVRIVHPSQHQGDWNDLLVSGQAETIKQYIYQKNVPRELATN